MFTGSDQHWPITAKAYQLVAIACRTNTADRESALTALHAGIRDLTDAGDIGQAAAVLAMIAAVALNFDEVGAEHIAGTAAAHGEFEAIILECLQTLADEDSEHS